MARYKPLKQELLEEPYRFDFFQAVRLLERIHPDKKAVGRDAMPHEEVVRFRSRIALDFPASQIHEFQTSFDEHTEEERLDMLINFMGMVGMNGVLPIHYTETILDRIRRRDTSMWAFMDIFTHRAVSMFFVPGKNTGFPFLTKEARMISRNIYSILSVSARKVFAVECISKTNPFCLMAG